MPCHIVHHRPFALGIEEDHHIPCHDNGIKEPTLTWRTRDGQLDRGEIFQVPWQMRCLGTSRVEQVGIAIHADHLKTTLGQLDSDSSGATASIEY